MAPVLRGAKWAGAHALRAGKDGAGWARDRGGELIDRIPVDRIEHDVRETIGDARERIDGIVQQELRDLRRMLRQQRKRMGI